MPVDLRAGARVGGPWTDRAGRALGQRYTNANLGGGASGPISFDRAFYNISYQLGRNSNDLRVWSYDDAKAKYATAGIAMKNAVQAAIDKHQAKA